MTGEIEAAGELVTGGLLGRAVEPHAGEGAHGHGIICLNCGTALVGPHCHQCGQSGHVHRTLGGIGHELLHGVFHFEGKLWRTLPLLAWRPGQLTRRYIDGERARFVSPIAIFLFSIFALFAVFSSLGVMPTSGFGTTPTTQEDVGRMRVKLNAQRDRLMAERATLRHGSGPARLTDNMIHAVEKSIAELKIGESVKAPIEMDGIDVNTGWHRLDHGIEKVMKNPGLAAYKFQSTSYKYSWLLIVLSVPFVALMFAWRRQFKLYDHAVFVTYSIAFMSLLFITVSLLRAAGLHGGFFTFVVFAIVVVHMYRQLKDTYGLSRGSAIARTIALQFIAFVVLLLFLTIILAMGVLG
jgi:hypothetical protein